jgi:predicted flavoprotein YhiN
MREEHPRLALSRGDLFRRHLLRDLAAQGSGRAEWFRAWKLSEAVAALLDSDSTDSVDRCIAQLKSFNVRLTRPRPIAEAISSAGGVRWSELGDNLMLRKAPGVFVAGEMIDWEAPTGGYLLQGCLTTGTQAGLAAAKYLMG